MPKKRTKYFRSIFMVGWQIPQLLVSSAIIYKIENHFVLMSPKISRNTSFCFEGSFLFVLNFRCMGRFFCFLSKIRINKKLKCSIRGLSEIFMKSLLGLSSLPSVNFFQWVVDTPHPGNVQRTSMVISVQSYSNVLTNLSVLKTIYPFFSSFFYTSGYTPRGL